MLKYLLILFQFAWFVPLQAQLNVVMNIRHLPTAPASPTLYIAGSFNGWNPAAKAFGFEQKADGQYSIALKLAPGNYEYKITRGSWATVECTAKGFTIQNRDLKLMSDTVLNIDVEEWQDNFKSKPAVSTASRHVHIADTAFWIPQLNRKRRIIVYLPDDYQVKRYPVLYMHDGQNLFDDAGSFAGEWGVDEFLDSVKLKKCIVVGIDNLSSKRLNEYCPFDFRLNPQSTTTNKGEGSAYVDFIVNTLKPFIDKQYLTLSNKANTYIAGSSMGGLISLYAVLRYPKIFGGAGIFSPSVWICKPQLLGLIDSVGKNVKSKLFFYCGTKESETMVPDMLEAYQRLQSASKSSMTKVIREDGKHNEPTWRKELPLFYEWLMK